MASIEKIRKKMGPSKGPGPSTSQKKPNSKNEDGKGKDSKAGSVISVKEAVSEDQHDTLEKGTEEENNTEKEKVQQPEPADVPKSSPSAGPSTEVSPRPTSAATSRPASATNTRPTSRPPSAASLRVAPQSNRPGSASQERPGSSLSQQKARGAVGPIGSTTSLKSREAWIQGDDSPPTRPTSAVSKTSIRGADNAPINASLPMETNPSSVKGKSGFGSSLFRTNNTVHPQQRGDSHLSSSANLRPSSAQSSGENNTVASMGPAEMNEAHAYVPYIYARNSIAKIVQDMKNMKVTHIRIVHDIEDNFRAIEDETQAQFNLFVVNLRDQYGIKVKTFRQVIEVHRLELQQKEQYWDEVLMSLSARNKGLLQDKKVLLIQNKLEFERLEKEKNETVQALQKQLDEANVTHAAAKKDLVKQHEGEVAVLVSQHDEETKVAKDSLETEKIESGKLREEIEELKRRLSLSVVTSEHQVSAEPVVVVAEMTEEERQGIKDERERMTSERDTMMQDRKEIEREREQFAEERNKFQEERIIIQGDFNNALKEKEEWKIKYDVLKSQLGDLADIKAKYDALSAQFSAVSALAVVAAVENKEKTDEKILKAQADKDIMAEEKLQMDRDIEKWEENFRKENGRDPEGKDRPDSIRELEVSRKEAETMVTSLDTQITTLETLKKGDIPTATAVVATPIEIREPEIRTIEVKVPDPEIMVSLQAAQSEVDKLKSELTASKDEASDLRGNISKMEAELAESKAEISMLKAKISGLEEQNSNLEQKLVVGLAAGAVATDGETDEKLKTLKAEYEAKLKEAEKAKKGLEKDLKKIMKAQAKQGTPDEANRMKELLDVTVREVRGINGQAELAANLVDEKLKSVKAGKETINKENEEKKKEYQAWAAAWAKKNGNEPTPEEREKDSKGKLLFSEFEKSSSRAEDHDLTIQALEMIATGAVPEKMAPKQAELAVTVAATAAIGADTEKLEEKVEDLQDQLDELKGENERLAKDKEDLKEEVSSLKSKVAVGVAVSTGDDLEELSGQISELQKQVDEAEAKLAEERSAHSMTRDELEAIQAQLEALRADLETQQTTGAAELDAASGKLNAEIANLQLKLTAAENRVEQLDKDRLANVPVDAQKEIKALKAKLVAAEKDKDEKVAAKATLEANVKQLSAKITTMEKANNVQKATSTGSEQKLKQLKTEKDKEIKEVTSKFEKREKDRAKQEEKKIAALEKKIQNLEIAAATAGTAASVAPGKGKAEKGGVDKATQEKLRESQRELKEAQNNIKRLESELKSAQKSSGGGHEEAREKKKQEKILKELEKKLEMLSKKNEKNDQNLKKQEEELDVANKDITTKTKEIATLRAELDGLGVAAAEGIEAAAKVKELETEVKKLTEENKVLTENYNSERVLRKKYYNMVEDMKGKIRVYCRVRPMSKSETNRGNHSICKSPDEYTINVESSRGVKEFQFDTIFMPEHSQEKVFEDTNNLIQSAVDGYNVCIFAYGQTGSGKTYTIIGDSAGNTPGIAPRAFERIFALADEVKSKFSVKVQVYMLELYNDKLLDLFTKSNAAEDKLDIKKDRKGMVVVQGAEVKNAKNEKELWTLFEEGSKTRHVASTKMNAESSRSHLIVGITIESTNKMSGQVTKGKLSLVDLAGSERAAKTEASAEQLKEAMSINKSLSALGDVISALSSEQSFIPYRNNKLTMLMQDSLGGNAKTLMFVNVSPADYNADETVTSLTYAARVKLITNDASKNAENKEINRLKSIISKLKAGEAVEEAEDDGEQKDE